MAYPAPRFKFHLARGKKFIFIIQGRADTHSRARTVMCTHKHTHTHMYVHVRRGGEGSGQAGEQGCRFLHSAGEGGRGGRFPPKFMYRDSIILEKSAFIYPSFRASKYLKLFLGLIRTASCYVDLSFSY